MGAGLQNAFAADPEKSLPVRAIAGGAVALGIQAFDAERAKGFIVKRLRLFDIADAERDVIQHVDRLP
jgi:hypothetical protein